MVGPRDLFTLARYRRAVTENSPGDHLDEHAASVERALAESTRQERDERNADIARQQSADDRIVRALRRD